MGKDPSRRDANTKPDEPLPPPGSHGGPDELGMEADEITPYRDRPSHDGKHGDAADEPASGYPTPAPETDRGKGK